MPGPLTPFPGINPLTISTTPGAGAPGTVVNDASHGRVAVPSIINGNNDVTAGNLNAAPQAIQDTLNWILWRLPDTVNGGDYTAYTALLKLKNQLELQGNVSIKNAILSGLSGAALVWNDVAVFLGAVTFSSGSVEFDVPSTYAGANGYRVGRKTSITTAASGFNAQRWDTVWLYNTGADYDVTLTNPNTAGAGGSALPQGIEVEFVIPGAAAASGVASSIQTPNTGGVLVKDSSGNVLANFSNTVIQGGLKSMRITTVSVGGTIKWDVLSFALFEA